MAAKILIIDDDTSLRRVLEYNLQEEGYEVVTAADGEAGLALFAECSPALVVTDLKMPGISGFQVLATIKERSPATLVIVITAFGAIDTAIEASASRNCARSRVLGTIPTCGNVIRNAHTNWTSSRSLIVNSGRNPPAAGRKRGTLTAICACQQCLNKCSKCAASATASSCHLVRPISAPIPNRRKPAA